MNEKKKKIFALIFFALSFVSFSCSAKKREKKIHRETEIIQEAKTEPENFSCFSKGYPDLNFRAEFDEEKSDWKIFFEVSGEEKIFYWCSAKLLPPEEISDAKNFWPILYRYEKNLKDPAEMSDEEKFRLKEFSSASNRREGKGTPMFFFETVYESSSRAQIEKNLVAANFLGRKTTIHKRIKIPLENVERKILDAAKSDESVKSFVANLKSADAYNWRLIDGTTRKSFHSLGIALDLIPKKITGEIFWSWARDKNPDGWMLTPLSRRWLPPARVVEIFESEGFIWGGKWGIWDNMHFEFHPELILFSR
jgi:hypothetical protein